MTGALKAIEVASIAAAILLLAYLLDLARERGVLLKSLAVSFLVLTVALIGGSVLWFETHAPIGLR